ncbi:hypothetical protein ADUPG1_009223 [Aduncisulcus paluster]|uniref:Sodium/calcium exchanger membrane region domain-containing protein n=1 Tax=Aduncisulcus paluster TaxID=2918883 RepID=A0ABQ5KUT0_9EUKA|nr:hypothetical protein ADUPG1_009223 [Aduncisulcus paluster]
MPPTNRIIIKAAVSTGIIVMFTFLGAAFNFFGKSENKSPLFLAGNDDATCNDPGSFTDPCQYVLDNCDDIPTYFNYLKFLYCDCHSGFTKFLGYLLLIVWCFVLFIVLGTTADRYFCPALEEISDALKLAPDVAGVTFLALGNGAPDIFSVIAGLSAGSADLSVGELIGAGNFISQVIYGIIIIGFAPTLQKSAFIRDSVMFLAVVILVFVLMLATPTMHIWQGILLLIVYFAYVIIVVILHYWRGSEEEEDLSDLEITETSTSTSCDVRGTGDEKAAILAQTSEKERLASALAEIVDVKPESRPSVGSKKKPKQSGATNKTKGKNKAESQEQTMLLIPGDESTSEGTSSSSTTSAEIITTGIQAQKTHVERKGTQPINATSTQEIPLTAHVAGAKKPLPVTTTLGADVSKLTRRLSVDNAPGLLGQHLSEEDEDKFLEQLSAAEVEKEEFSSSYREGFFTSLKTTISDDWDDAGTFGKITYILEFPFTIARNFTVFPARDDQYSRFYVVLAPLVLPLFIAFSINEDYVSATFGKNNFSWVLLFTLIGLGISIVLFIVTIGVRHPPYWSLMTLGVIGFVIAILWMNTVANEVVSLLRSLGLSWDIPDLVLGQTILAWGNSVGDLVADLFVAKNGRPSMAVAGVFAGPLLNICLGLGISITWQAAAKGSVYMPLNGPTIFSICVLIVGLVIILVSGILTRYKPGKIYGWIFCIIYAIGCIGTTIWSLLSS